MARQPLAQHLDLLIKAKLFAVVRRGRLRRHNPNPTRIHEIQQRWTRDFDHRDFDAVDTIQQRAVGTAMNFDETSPTMSASPISSHPREVWNAPTVPEIMQPYWDGVAVFLDRQADRHGLTIGADKQDRPTPGKSARDRPSEQARLCIPIHRSGSQ